MLTRSSEIERLTTCVCPVSCATAASRADDCGAATAVRAQHAWLRGADRTGCCGFGDHRVCPDFCRCVVVRERDIRLPLEEHRGDVQGAGLEARNLCELHKATNLGAECGPGHRLHGELDLAERLFVDKRARLGEGVDSGECHAPLGPRSLDELGWRGVHPTGAAADAHEHASDCGNADADGERPRRATGRTDHNRDDAAEYETEAEIKSHTKHLPQSRRLEWLPGNTLAEYDADMTPWPSLEGDLIVATPSGRVRGAWVGSTAVFKGIPYAEEPSGPLRFAAPRVREPWDGVLDALEFGPTPLSGDAGFTLIPESSIPGTDILSVNVWTPSPAPGANLPVVVWIHGGGFISGSPVSPWYHGHAFARDGVVLVTMSYRLGFTGFGWIDDATPNRGVLDWIRALEWVQHHIHAFGGDPDAVTVAGQSAGGGAVLTLLGVPEAVGLFHGGYAMSPAVADPSVDAARHRSHHLARLAGVPPKAAGFARLSEQRVVELEPSITRPALPHLLHDVHRLLRDGLMIGPVVDGKIVRCDTMHAVAHCTSSQVPLVVGTTTEELFGAFGAFEPLARVTTDMFFHSWIPRIATARAASLSAGPTWSYSFAWHGASPGYAGHCIDIPFVFDNLNAPGVGRLAGPRPPQELADEVHGALVSFAKHGTPGWAQDEGAGPTHVFDAVREPRA